MGEVRELVDAIAETARLQVTMLGEVNDTVGSIDRIVQQNAAMVEQSAASSRGLAGEASRLADLVARFLIGTPAKVQPTPIAVAPRSQTVNRAPATHGALALAPSEDWSDF